MKSSYVRILSTLRDAGHEAFLVGGGVRDALLGVLPKDWDIATDAVPEEVLKLFRAAGVRTIGTGLAHGTVTVLPGKPVEVTTYRGGCLRADLTRRDLTLNAMALDADGRLIDPFGGARDIERKIIRAVEDPDARFREDPLRILRALRFAAALGFEIEPATRRSLFCSKTLLKGSAAERIASELTQIFCAPDAARILLDFVDVLAVVLPELLPMKGFAQRNAHHVHDVLSHTALVVENVDPLPHLRWAALLHDVGKPSTFSLGEDGVGHFYGHAEAGAQMAEAILRRLKLDNETIHRTTNLIRGHSFSASAFEATERALKRLLNQWTPEAFFDLLKLKRADVRGQNPELIGRLAHLNALEARARAMLDAHVCFTLRDLAVKGDDLIALGLAPGPELGRTLNELLNLVLDDRLPNEKDALLKIVGPDVGGAP